MEVVVNINAEELATEKFREIIDDILSQLMLKKRYFTKSELAKFLHKNQNTITDYIVNHKLPFIKSGNSILIDINDVYKMYDEMKETY